MTAFFAKNDEQNGGLILKYVFSLNMEIELEKWRREASRRVLTQKKKYKENVGNSIICMRVYMSQDQGFPHNCHLNGEENDSLW